ncbi:hypothetical protein JOQ06_014176, partial [Pogonophryne albipinna]
MEVSAGYIRRVSMSTSKTQKGPPPPSYYDLSHHPPPTVSFTHFSKNASYGQSGICCSEVPGLCGGNIIKVVKDVKVRQGQGYIRLTSGPLLSLGTQLSLTLWLRITTDRGTKLLQILHCSHSAGYTEKKLSSRLAYEESLGSADRFQLTAAGERAGCFGEEVATAAMMEESLQTLRNGLNIKHTQWGLCCGENPGAAKCSLNSSEDGGRTFEPS